MVKKRLSDLLREEGEKSEAEQLESIDSGVSEAQVAAPEPASQSTPQITPQSEPEAPAPDLEAILQLKQDIEAAQTMARAAEAEFNQQTAALQAKITEQDSIIQQLKAEAEAAIQQASQVSQLKAEAEAAIQQASQVSQLKAELETARQTILQLSQVNQPNLSNPPKAAMPARGATFLGGRSQPPTLPSPAVLPSPRAAEPELEPSQSQMIIPSRTAKPAGRPKLHELELHKVLDHPTQPGSLPPMSSEPKPAEKGIKLSETDVGWMD